MILVIGGTKEAEKVKLFLEKRSFNQNKAADFKTNYGEKVSKGIVFLPRSLNCPMTAHLIKKYKVKVLIDATPIYFKGASLNSMSACRMTEAKYIRFEAPSVSLNENKEAYRAKNIEEASGKAMDFGKTIFLNIGNNNMDIFAKKGLKKNKRIVVRISDPGALTNSWNFGIKHHDVLFIDGIFSEGFNRAIIREYGVSVFVTRDLGAGNGTQQEIAAAVAEKVPLILIERPRLNYGAKMTDYDSLLSFLEKNYHKLLPR